MKVYNHISEFSGARNVVVTTGTFDGVHLGHRSIIRRLQTIANQVDGETLILTFDPHPRMVLFPDDNDLKLINTREEKIRLMEEAGVDHLIIHPFSKEFSRMTSLEFIRDVLVGKFQTKRLVIGYNHHFGRNREGGFEHLLEFGPVYGFEVEEIPASEVDHIEISSTKIRNALHEGDVKTANSYLGSEFEFSGKVIEGKKLGRKLGYPTANIQIADPYKIKPANGVYVVKAFYQEMEFGGMMNIGTNPTTDVGNGIHVEVNIFNFDKEIYGEQLSVKVLDRIRDEKKFNGLDELIEAIGKDKEFSLEVLKNIRNLNK
ncbi:MAG: bifunctional riboflavin kinase/FAD synthetase [Bacteroidia bacterium]|nr:bifunctional riboflavin kinase/FAD synthetase [Bacteroidia bacterium]